MCIHTISIFSPKKWKSRLEFLKAKQEGRHFWVRKWWIVVMALAMRRGLFSREKKKICEIGRKWEKCKCIYWFFRRHLLYKGHGNIEIILLKEVNFTVVLLCIIETHLINVSYYKSVVFIKICKIEFIWVTVYFYLCCMKKTCVKHYLPSWCIQNSYNLLWFYMYAFFP